MVVQMSVEDMEKLDKKLGGWKVQLMAWLFAGAHISWFYFQLVNTPLFSKVG